MRFGTWKINCLCRVGAIKSVAGEIEKYKLHLAGVQLVRWKRKGYQTAHIYMFFYRKGNVIHKLGTGFFVTVSTVKGVKFVTYRMSYLTLRGR